MGSTVLKPGESTSFVFPYGMPKGMGGPHHFEVHIGTNDPERKNLVFQVYANTIEQ